MPRNAKAPTSSRDSLGEALLRSINVVYDSEEPSRVAHFRPTAKSVALIRALAGEAEDKATIVVAPYGTGKSIAATYLLHLIEGSPAALKLLRPVERRLREVSPDMANWAQKRRRGRKRGLVIPLSGHYADLPNAFKSAVLDAMRRVKLGRQARTIEALPCSSFDELIQLLDVLQRKCEAASIDRVVIVWDEFGRHLEALLAETRPDRLHDIQSLAEYVSRAKGCAMSLGLLLHRRLMQYAGSATHAIRQEWQKIEGRFATLEYVDDSREVYRLIGDYLTSRMSGKRAATKASREAAKSCHGLGLFKDFGINDLSALLTECAPLHPLSVYLLPRFASRVSQNERTLFGFLERIEEGNEVDLSELYDYFSPAMQSDTSLGGTYKQWLEAESGLSKTQSETESRVLKSACILGLGIAGERARTSLERLRFARSSADSELSWNQAIMGLLERKLLLYRKHNDEVTIWHGTDADLLGRLQEERDRAAPGFDLIHFLRKEAPPPVWRPVGYNSEFGVRRFLVGEYHTVYTLDAGLAGIEETLPPGTDGKVIYLIPESTAELVTAKSFAKQNIRCAQVLVAVPEHAGAIRDTALELHCLQNLRRDSDLLASDPLVDAELQQMIDDARDRMAHVVERITQPSAEGPCWFYRGQEISLATTGELLRHLSEMMRTVFSETPVIENEMIVRSQPSAVVVNARKKLVLGILERSGMPNLGLVGNFPDASMFRSVLLNTGLYRENSDGSWGFAEPSEVEDEKLKVVWAKFQEFVAKPAERPKSLRKELFDELRSPPIGLRDGVLPIFLAAALKAFPCFLSISRDGSYVEDLLPSTIEDMCRSPEAYRFVSRRMDETEEQLMDGLVALLGQQTPVSDSGDRARVLYDALVDWSARLPSAARDSRGLPESALAIRDALVEVRDPLRLVTDVLPRLSGGRDVLEAVSAALREIGGVTERYEAEASRAILDVIGLDSSSAPPDASVVARDWAACFSDELLCEIPEGIGKALVRLFRTPSAGERALLDRVAGLILGKPITKWDDSCPERFAKRLQDVVGQLESAAIEQSLGSETPRAVSSSLEGLAKRRLEQWVGHLTEIAGEEATRSFLMEIASRTIGGVRAYDS